MRSVSTLADSWQILRASSFRRFFELHEWLAELGFFRVVARSMPPSVSREIAPQGRFRMRSCESRRWRKMWGEPLRWH
jgi:hypothetical protein